MARPPSDTETVAKAFHGVTGRLESPMVIVTTRQGDDRAGCLVGFATQVSIRPPRFLVCLSDKNRTYRVARGSDRLAVHVVPSREEQLAALFGGETGDDTDKFAACDWEDGPHGLPILTACASWFAGPVVERVAFGDHVGFVVEPEIATHGADDEQLPSRRAWRFDPGHGP